MPHGFDRDYWDGVWAGGGDAGRATAMSSAPPNPHLVREISGTRPGTALDAGCGAGAEALWLAARGWDVTGADITAAALEVAADRAAAAGVGERIRWVEADLSVWEPRAMFDLVASHYAHPAMPQLDFYERLAGWVAPGGTLFVVGHLHHHGFHHHGGHGHGGHGHGGHGHGHPPAEATVTADAVTARLGPDEWEIATAREVSRGMPGPGGAPVTIHDVVVRAVRRR